MLQPHRTPKRRWTCQTCRAKLGTISVNHHAHTLRPDGLTNARPDPSEPGVWWLRCVNNHETRWAGEFTLTYKEAA